MDTVTATRLLLVDEPYASPYLRETIETLGLPLVLTPSARSLGFTESAHTLTEGEAIRLGRDAERLLVYTSSENCLGWLAENLPGSPLQASIRQFKDKAVFRERTAGMDPGYFFRRVRAEEVAGLSAQDLPMPLILKPSVGFFSMGVQRISSPADWAPAANRIEAERVRYKDLYPKQVLDTSDFVIEACIPGEEFAIDAYLDPRGEPVVLSIWKHVFASEEDMGDRLYTTSREMIESHLHEFTNFLDELARLTGSHDTPVHVELRRDSAGTLRAIEVNPMRFGGWCTTADMTQRAFGHNPYQLFFQQRRPDWPTALGGMEERSFSIVVLNNSTGHDGRDIESFDYETLRARFHRPLELRRTDFARFPLFGFLFLETPVAHASELDWILHSDLTEFVTLRR